MDSYDWHLWREILLEGKVSPRVAVVEFAQGFDLQTWAVPKYINESHYKTVSSLAKRLNGTENSAFGYFEQKQ